MAGRTEAERPSVANHSLRHNETLLARKFLPYTFPCE
jgi:hypothetical protein